MAPSCCQVELEPMPPFWGCQNEAKPEVMARKIAAAADYGVNAFIFDWYYYNDGPYLDNALDEGFLHAANNARVKFALMWANHDWYDIQGYNPTNNHLKLLYPGKVTPATWSLPDTSSTRATGGWTANLVSPSTK